MGSQTFAQQLPFKSWVNYENAKGAFSVQLPDDPKDLRQEVPNPKDKTGAPFVVNLFYSPDRDTLTNYIVRYNDYPSGSYLAHPDKIFDAMTAELSAKGKIEGKPLKIFKGGYEGRSLKMFINDKFYSEVHVYVRANRVYVLLKQNIRPNITAFVKDNFFNSFTLLPYQPANFFYYEPPGSSYSVRLPSQPAIQPDTTLSATSFLSNGSSVYCTNPNSGGVYVFECFKMGEYFRAKHIDSLYRQLEKRFITYPDSLTKVDTITISGRPARELLSVNRETREKHRRRILIDDGMFYLLSAHIGAEEYNSPISNIFFNSLSIKKQSNTFDLYSSKAEKICRDLQSTDTTTYKKAKGALSYYDFDKDELPFVYNALQKKYTDDTTAMGARHKLVKVFRKVHDDRSLAKLQDVFNTADADELKATILATLPDIDKKEGYPLYLNLLTATPALKVRDQYDLFSPLTDSLQYVAANYKSILPLLKYAAYRRDVLNVFSWMLYDDKKENYIGLVKNSFDQLTQFALADLDQYLSRKDSDTNDYRSAIYKYLNIMSEVKGKPITNTFTDKLINQDPKGYPLSDAVTARIKNDLAVPQSVLNRLMDTLSQRYDIMEALYKANKAALIPLKYKKQDEFAKLCLYNYADDDEERPDKITLIGTIPDKTQIYYTFKFTMPNRDEPKTYLGIAGPFKPGSTKLNFEKNNAYTDWEEKKTNWQLQAKKLISDLKKQIVDNKKEELNAKLPPPPSPGN